jgi:glyoxylase-like metal-dependent hydrolase (beta-lactamase superfamily II)
VAPRLRKIAAVPPLEPIELLHQASERVIGSYLLDTEEGPAVVDCGPTTCVDALKAGLAARGLALADVAHLLLTHIHLDHGGAAGVLVREHPRLVVHVSGVGAPHLVDPSRLERSARRLYGETFDPLWGELAPVPEENVRVLGDRVLGLECFPSPGHASHHVCFLGGDGTLFAGDATGVRIRPARFVAPHAPPPDIDLEGWERTFAEIERRAPARFALPHFGVVADTGEHLARAREQLARWAERVRAGASEDEFVAAARADLLVSDPDEEPYYALAAPFWQSFLGLRRYWDKRAAA